MATAEDDAVVGRTAHGAALVSLLAAFVGGAAVMILEILGTRVIGPVFGVSLFVWSALIAITLSSLATGYYLGGRLGDRYPTALLLAYVLAASGICLLAVPVVQAAVLLRALSFGVQLGPLIAAAVLFAPTLTLLGMVSPICIRLTTRDISLTGRRVGNISFVSTFGSFIATLATPYLLIPTFETSSVLLGTAAVLLVFGAALFVRHRAGALALALALIAIASRVGSLGAPDLPSQIRLVAREQSPYGLVEVIEDAEQGVRLLRADHSIIGGQFLNTRAPCFAFVELLSSVTKFRPSAKDALAIGLGAGSLPMALSAAGIRTDVVEIDPAVTRMARSYFDFRANGDVYTEDARTYVQRTGRKYDAIVHDTFSGGATPEHLLSAEFVDRLRATLKPGGALVVNFPGYATGPHAAAAEAVARTLRDVFRFVRVFRDEPAEGQDEATNLVFFASDAELDVARVPFRSLEVLQHIPPGPVIKDSWNPLGRLQLTSASEHFRAMNALLPPVVWIH